MRERGHLPVLLVRLMTDDKTDLVLVNADTLPIGGNAVFDKTFIFWV